MEYAKGSKEKFYQDIERGSKGEDICFKLFRKMNNVVSVNDLRKDPEYQQKDIDFSVQYSDGSTRTLEVKTDYMAERTGNMVYEKVCSGAPGCFEKTEADSILYVILGNKKEILDLNPIKLREFVRNRTFRYCKMGDNAEGYVIPLKDLGESGAVNRVYHYQE